MEPNLPVNDIQPPHDLAAERITLGAMLLSAPAATEIGAILAASDFYKPAHSAIYNAILAAQGEGRPTSPVAVAADLLHSGWLARVGGAPYLHTLLEEVPTPAQAPYYARIVADCARRRRVVELGARIQQRGMAPQADLSGLRTLLLQEAEEIAVDGPGPRLTPAIDWATLLSTNYAAMQFITEPLLSPGAQIALVGDGKVGKSLFCYEWACRLATGMPFLGNPARDPVRVLYIDQENSHPELQRRALTMGFSNPDALQNLVYMSFVSMGALDTPTGAADLLRYVDWAKPEVMFLDTVSRMIQGEENTADTWLQLYRLSLRPLKDRGLACIRLDHFGKDRERGSRGSSAKSQDVDHVWEMMAMPGEVVQLLRTHTRNGIGKGVLTLRRAGSPQELGTTTHVLVDRDEAVRSGFIVQDRLNGLLIEAGVPWDASIDTLRKFFRNLGERVGTDRLRELAKWRKEHNPLNQEPLDLGYLE